MQTFLADALQEGLCPVRRQCHAHDLGLVGELEEVACMHAVVMPESFGPGQQRGSGCSELACQLHEPACHRRAVVHAARRGVELQLIAFLHLLSPWKGRLAASVGARL